MANTLPKKYPGTPAYVNQTTAQQQAQALPQKYPGTPAPQTPTVQAPQNKPQAIAGTPAPQTPTVQAPAPQTQGYQPSVAVTAAQQTLQQIQAQKPQGYESKYGAQLQGILDQIQNPGQFKYEFNGDNLFKAYADQYMQKGKQAMLDTMGRAAGLTGGYGNTYAQNVGQQAYQQNLLDLYNVGLDLRDRAYGQYRDQLADQKDLMGILQGMDESDYGRYQDALNLWLMEEGNAYNRAADARDFDYGAYQDQLDNDFRNREQDWRESTDARDFAEKVRQANLDENYRNRVQDWSESTDLRDYLESVRRADLDENFRNREQNWRESTDQRDFDEAVRQANLDEAYRNRVQGWNESTDQRDFEEAVRQANLDEAYRNRVQGWNESTDQRDYERAVLENDRNFDRSVLESDRDFDWRSAVDQRDYDRAVLENNRDFDWRSAVDQRDYERNVMENDRNYYTNYAAQMLANGQMPSADILALIGLSEEDARKLLVEQVAGGGGGPNLVEGDVQYFPDGTLRILKNGKFEVVDPSQVTADKIKYGAYDSYKAGSNIANNVLGNAGMRDLMSDIGYNPYSLTPQNTTNTTKSKETQSQWALQPGNSSKTNNSSIVLKTAEEIKKLLGNSGGLKYGK